jgi:sugar O-acyltransferase (sialic acid O-acetyltransferase NeuD family)
VTVVILGAGGHAEVVGDAMRCQQRSLGHAVTLLFLDDDPRRHGHTLPGGMVMGAIGMWRTWPDAVFLPGIGDNKTRARVVTDVAAPFGQATHPGAILADGVRCGDGTVVAAGVVVNIGSTIGRHVILNTSSSVDHHCEVGDYAHIAPGARLGGAARVGEGAMIGMGALILPGRTVGAWAVVGAGAVVTRDVAPGAVVAGIPATVRVPC